LTNLGPVSMQLGTLHVLKMSQVNALHTLCTNIVMLHNADADDDHSILAPELVALERSIPEFGESQCLEVGEYSILVELIE